MRFKCRETIWSANSMVAEVAKELLKHERKLMATMEAITEKVDVGLVDLAKSRLELSDAGEIADGDLRSRIAHI